MSSTTLHWPRYRGRAATINTQRDHINTVVNTIQYSDVENVLRVTDEGSKSRDVGEIARKRLEWASESNLACVDVEDIGRSVLL